MSIESLTYNAKYGESWPEMVETPSRYDPPKGTLPEKKFGGVRGDIERTQDLSTVAFQNNAWEKGKPGTLPFLLGASRGGGGGLVHSARL